MSYHCSQNLDEICEIIDHKLSEKERLNHAFEYAGDILRKVNVQIIVKKTKTVDDRIARLESTAGTYELLFRVIENIDSIKPKDRVQYRSELNHLLKNFINEHFSIRNQ